MSPVGFREDFVAGARAMAPLLPAGATVGLVTGVAGVAVGLPAVQVAGASVLAYSPSVLLAAFKLLAVGAPPVVLVVTALTVGVRFVILSLSIAPYLEDVPRRWRVAMAYFLWTPTYALAVERFDAEPSTDRRAFYLGTAVPLWLVVQGSLVAGAVLGARVPDTLQLEFVVPLAFVALVVRLLDRRSMGVAAVVAGVVALAVGGIPLNAGVVVATVVGTAAGVLADRWEASR